MKIFRFIILIFVAPNSFSQSPLTIDQAVKEALFNNGSIHSAELEAASSRQLKKTSFDLPKTDVMLMYGQYNSYAKDNNLTVTQSIPFSALGSQGALNNALVTSSEMKKAVTENEVVYQVRQVFLQLAFLKKRHQLLLRQDSIYEGFLKSASARYTSGETNMLEKTTAEVQRNDAKNQLRQNESEVSVYQIQLKTLLGSNVMPDVSENELSELRSEILYDSIEYRQNPALAYMRQQVNVSEREKKLAASKFAPDLLIGFFSQTLIGTPNPETGTLALNRTRFTGVQIGLAVPLWFAPHQGRVRAAEFTRQALQSNYNYYETGLQGRIAQAVQRLTANRNSLTYYKNSALPNADLILRQSQAAFRNGEIGYAEFLLGIKNSISIQEGYLRTLNDYNQSVIYFEYLTGKK
jgi:cobalt-zinc-cadmium resistance protein CzcA